MSFFNAGLFFLQALFSVIIINERFRLWFRAIVKIGFWKPHNESKIKIDRVSPNYIFADKASLLCRYMLCWFDAKHLKNLITNSQLLKYNSFWQTISCSSKASNSWWWRPTTTRGRYAKIVLKQSSCQTQEKGMKGLSSLHSSLCSSSCPYCACLACKQSSYLQMRTRAAFFWRVHTDWIPLCICCTLAGHQL